MERGVDGRFVGGDDPLVPVPIRLHRSTLERLRTDAAAQGQTLTAHIRSLIEPHPRRAVATRSQ
jgi:hypothetical protein